MPFDWEAFLDLAEELVSKPASASHAAKRTAISRAYYAVAMLTRDRLRMSGAIFSTSRSVHQEIFSKLSARSEPQLLEVARGLSYMRQKRNSADYDAAFDPVEAQKDVKLARHCIEMVKAHLR